ncbi:MAG: hypothetical protein ACREON_18685 [Gemmatimonadaceae bacterium]
MTAPFVSSLRSRREPLRLAAPSGETISIRVQMPELWDVVRVEVGPGEPVSSVKRAVLAELDPRAREADYVMKLRGFEVLDEQAALREAGAVNGSIFLLESRRRRPVR